ncbi:unnamed protein product [Urochloa humidicola]
MPPDSPSPSPTLLSGPHDRRSPASTPASATTPSGRVSSPKLSPAAEPFYPSLLSSGRCKTVRWRNDSDDNDGASSCASSPRPSYRDVLLRAPSTAAPTPTAPSTSTAPPSLSNHAPRSVHNQLGPHGGPRPGRRPARRRGHTRQVHGLPVRPLEGAAARSRLRSVVVLPQATTLVDDDGWTMAESRRTRSRRRRRQRLAQRLHLAKPQVPPPASRIPAALAGRCLNCLSYKHVVARCRLLVRCLRCRGFGHLARVCTRPRSTATSSSSGEGDGQRPVRARQASPPTGRDALQTAPRPNHRRARLPSRAPRGDGSPHGNLARQQHTGGEPRRDAPRPPPRQSSSQRSSSPAGNFSNEPSVLAVEDSPPDHPDLRHAVEACNISRSVEMDEEMAKQKIALIAAALDGHDVVLHCSVCRTVLRCSICHAGAAFAPDVRAAADVLPSPCSPTLVSLAPSLPAEASLPAASPPAVTTVGKTGSTPSAGKEKGGTLPLELGSATSASQGSFPASAQELVAFEAQLPTRFCQAATTATASDPMLLVEISEQPSIRAHQQGDRRRSSSLTSPTTGMKTYRRRPRKEATPNGLFGDDAGSHMKPQLQPPMAAEQLGVEAEMSGAGPSTTELELPDTEEPVAGQQAQLRGVGPSTDGPAVRRRQTVGLASARKRPRTSADQELEDAKAATAAFLASVSQALQAPLATLPLRGSAAAPAASAQATPPRRSVRLANQPLNSTVRASKKGEVLVLRKLGLLPADPTSAGSLHPELASVFRGPLDTSTFAAMRDMFPAARALSDADLRAVAMQLQASDAFSAS